MKVAVLHKEFSKLLNNASRFVSSRAQLPVLANLKIKAQGAKLIVEATNLEMSISGSIGAKIEKEGEVAVPARTLTDLVSNIRAEKLNIASEGESLNIFSSDSKNTISGINTSDFPEVPESITPEFSLPKELFVGALSQVLFSCANEPSRPALSGVLMLFSKNNLSLVTSDGFRLSKKDIKILIDINKKVIVPRNIMLELSRILGDEKEIGVFVGEKDRQVLFGVGDVVFGSRLIEGEYPPFEKIIPTASSVVVGVNKEDLKLAIKRASVFARDGANTVKLRAEDNVFFISAESSRSGIGESSLEAKVKGPAIDIIFNYRYIEDFLSVVKGESVILKFNSASAAGVFLDSEEEDYLHLIMPVEN